MPKISLKYILGGLLIYAELLVVGFRGHICINVLPQWKSLCIIADAIAEKPWLIIVNSIFLALTYFYAIDYEMKARKFSFFRLVLYATTAVMFYSLWDVPLSGGGALTVALGCCFVGLCVLEIIKAFIEENYTLGVTINKIHKRKGFSNISKEEDLYDLGWSSYAKRLYEKLVATNVDEAYAIGVNAQWGYGKTTFLNEIKKNLTEDEILVEFNPWLSSSPDQIVKDFFENLKDELRIYDNYLDDEIDNYVSLLINLDVHPVITAIAKLWVGSSSKSISNSREKIQNRINKIGKKIIVVIDDLDRLEKDEIYEVLKLIRNTAKFKNLIYIVAYDRQYICSTLNQKGIVMPDSYLYKIFQMEVLLPAFEGDLIEKQLLAELKKQLEGEVQEVFIRAIEKEIKESRNTSRAIGYFLKNFRDVKRFANYICLEVEQVAATDFRYDILPRCLFWLELIHYSFEDVYLKLRSNYTYYLKETGYEGRLFMSDEKNEKNLVNSHCFEALSYLFGDFPDPRGVNNIHSFFSYFSLRSYVDQVSWSEFIFAINTKGDDAIKKKMEEWLDSPEGKTESLYLKFTGVKMGQSVRLTYAFDNYFNALQYWVDYKNDAFCKRIIPKICHHIVDPRNCRDTMIENIRSYFDKMINHFLEKRDNCLIVMKILTKLYPIEYGEGFINDNVIGYQDINEYIDKTFKKFIEDRAITVKDLCDDKSDIHHLIVSAKINGLEEIGGGPFFVFQNNLRDYFKNKEQRDSANILMNTFKINREKLNNGYDDVLRDELKEHIEKYFVSVIWFRNFLWQCVAEDRAVVDEYIKDNML